MKNPMIPEVIRMPKWVKRFGRPVLSAGIFAGIGALISLGMQAAGNT
jgi:hypothetical protein